jgi:hypothetical protein
VSVLVTLTRALLARVGCAFLIELLLTFFVVVARFLYFNLIFSIPTIVLPSADFFSSLPLFFHLLVISALCCLSPVAVLYSLVDIASTFSQLLQLFLCYF